MSSKRQIYTREFKLEAIELADRSDKPITQIEDELGIPRGLLHKWKRKLQGERQDAFRGHGQRTSAEAEMHQLRQENERLRQEREILRPGRAAPKKRWPSSRRARDEIPVHHKPPR